jgi:hypothetical protein
MLARNNAARRFVHVPEESNRRVSRNRAEKRYSMGSTIGLILTGFSLLLQQGGANEHADARPTEDRPSMETLRNVENRAFIQGERLVYDISYGVVRAGEGEMLIPEMTNVNGRDVYHIQLKARSVSPFSWVYRVDDLWETYIDRKGIFPWKFSERIREGGYSRDTNVEFDQINNLAITDDGEYEVPSYVHDMISAFYYVRTKDFSDMETGDIITLENFHRDSTYTLGVVFHGREEIRVKTGTFHTLKIEPLIKEGGFIKHEGAIHIWLTDDRLRVPVRMRTRIPLGSITADLRQYSGLRDAIRARVR